MKKFFAIFLLLMVGIEAKSLDNNNTLISDDDKIGTFDIYYKYDNWGETYHLKSTNGDTIVPKKKVIGYKHYLDVKANIFNMTIEKSFVSSNYDYLNIHPSGVAGVFIGYSSYKKEDFKKQWFGLISGLLAYEKDKYKTNINGVSYHIEKEKYGAIFSEGLKNWFDFFLENRTYIHTDNDCNFGLFNYCVDKQSAFILLPDGDFYYLKAKYKSNDNKINIDTDGYGIDFGIKFYYDHYFFNKNMFLGIEGRYVYGEESLKNNNDEDNELNDEIRDYYIQAFLYYRFNL